MLPTTNALGLRQVFTACALLLTMTAWASEEGYITSDLNRAEPWRLAMGRAAHRIIAFNYRCAHPTDQTFFNHHTIEAIVRTARIGDSSKLDTTDQVLKPDITNIDLRHVFEIKPWNDRGLQDARVLIRAYLASFNRAIDPKRGSFSGGTGHDGEMLVRFGTGHYIWRLRWRTAEPGIIQYRWEKSARSFDFQNAINDGQWTEISEPEMRQDGEAMSRVVDTMIDNRERLLRVQDMVGGVIEIVGTVTYGALSGAIFGRLSRGSQAGSGQVIPFPSSSSTPPSTLPAASGM